MKRWIGLAIAAFMSAAVRAAETQLVIDSAWIDGAGNEVFVSNASFHSNPMKPSARPISDLIKLFDEACLRVPVGTDFARSAVTTRSEWGFSYIDADAGTKAGARLDGWQATDVTLSSQRDTWPLAECNLLAARQNSDAIDLVTNDFNARLSARPSKSQPTRRSDGLKSAGTTLRWDVAGPSGKPRRVYASITSFKGVNYLHLGVTESANVTRR